MVKKLFIIFLFIITIYSISALSCNPTSINVSVNEGTTIQQQQITCTNSNSFNVTLFSSDVFFNTNPTFPLNIPNNSVISFYVTFNDLDAGNYNGFIYSSDGLTIPIKASVNSVDYDLIVFPTSKIVNIQQGQSKTQNVQVIVPINYPEPITIQSVSFNPDTDVASFGDLDLGQVNPGQTLNIPIKIDANNVQTGTYSTQISILATNSLGQINLPSVSLQVIVSMGISPTTNETFSTKPSCSLSANEFNLNNSYTFICTNAVSNLDVKPLYNEYLEGIKVDYSSGTYTYTFKAKKIGSSTFISTFEYKGSPLFEAFQKDFKVTPSGNSPVGGVNMELQFFQKGQLKTKSALSPEDTVIIAIDNSSKNVIENFKININGVLQNSTTIKIEPTKVYYLRVTANGYNDLIIENLSSQLTSISVNVFPVKDKYKVGEYINVTSDVNGTIIVDETIVTESYKLIKPGTILLRVEKDGYLTYQKNLTVESLISWNSNIPQEDWKKGKKIIIKLTENASWLIDFQEKDKDFYLANVNLSSGFGDTIEFKIEKYGIYAIKTNDNLLTQEDVVKSFVIWNPLTYHWIAQVIIGIIILLIIISLFFGGEDEMPLGGYGGEQ